MQVLSKLDGRLAELESRVRENVDTSIGQKLESIQTTMGSKFDNEVSDQVGKVSGKWIIPFVVLSMLLFGIMVAAYWQYTELKRTHMY